MKQKNLLLVFLFFSFSVFFVSAYSQEISEKEGKKVLEQIRKEIQREEKEKQKAAKEAQKAKEAEEKARIAAEKAEEKKGKKVIEEIRRDMNESLEEKVFRSKNNSIERTTAAATAFQVGKERMSFLKIEEEEIKELEKVLGAEAEENRVFLSQKFDEVHEEFILKNDEIQILSSENKRLNEYLSKLDTMEQKVKTGRN